MPLPSHASVVDYVPGECLIKGCIDIADIQPVTRSIKHTDNLINHPTTRQLHRCISVNQWPMRIGDAGGEVADGASPYMQTLLELPASAGGGVDAVKFGGENPKYDPVNVLRNIPFGKFLQSTADHAVALEAAIEDACPDGSLKKLVM